MCTTRLPQIAIFLMLLIFACQQKDRVEHSPMTTARKVAIAHTEPIQAIGTPINVDSFARPLPIPIKGNPKVVEAQTNEIPIERSSVLLFAQPSKVVVPGRDGFKKPKKVPAVGKIVPFHHRPAVPALAPSMKDAAVADIQYLDQSHGLPSASAMSIVEDRRGYLWIGSLGSGVCRYDGSGFLYLSKNEGLSHNSVPAMLEDRRGQLWFGTLGGGINCFDGREFVVFNEEGGLVHNDVLSMLEDRNGNLWIGTWGGGVCRFEPDSLDKTKGTFTHYTREQGLSASRVPYIFEDSRGHVWFATSGGGASRFDPAAEHGEGSFTHYTQREGLFSNSVNAIQEDGNGHIWLANGYGLSLFDPFSNSGMGSMTKYSTLDRFNNSRTAPSILLDSRNHLWWGTNSGGVWRHQWGNTGDGATFTNFSLAEGLSVGFIYDMIEDSRGGIWFGGWRSGGLSRYKTNSFKYLDKRHGLSDVDVRAVLEDSRGNLWFGTNKGGVNRYDGNQFIHYTANNGLTHNSVKAIFEDSKGNLWFGTRRGVTRFDGENFMQLSPEEGFPYLDIRDITEDKYGNIWIARYGLSCFDGVSFIDYDEEHGLADRRIWCILPDSRGDIWIGTHNGLSRFRPAENGRRGTFINYGTEEGLSDVHVESALEDSQGNLWFGTHHGGLNRYDGTSFTHYGIEEGLNHKTIHSIDEDQSGNLWMVTPKGVSLMIRSDKGGDPSEVRFYNFEATDGLRSIINTEAGSSVDLDSKNRLWIGNTSGVAMLDLNHYTLPQDPPRLYLNNIDINQTFVDYRQLGDPSYRQSMDFGESLVGAFDSVASFSNYPLSMKLPHHLNHLTFHFAAIDWEAPQKVIYRYQMEGLDKKWSQWGTENKADYRNLSPGKHTFLVTAQGGMQEVSKTLTYTFIILPPWWLSWWAYTLYGLALLGLFLAIRRYELNRYQVQSEAIRLQELDAVKTKLYTNITHEFRTPLTVIMGMIDTIRGYDEERRLIRRNSRSLLNLVNQILDLRKLESGKMSVQWVQGDIVRYLRYIQESFHSYAEAKDIRLHFLAEPENLEMDYDADKLLNIISNLLSNAIKYTPKGGDIYLQLKVDDLQKPTKLTLIVKDTGIGIPEDQLPHIFDRFHQVDDSSTRKAEGSGIGLALTKELVKLLGGRISVQSPRHKGSTFTVLLPIHRQADIKADNTSLDKMPFPALALTETEPLPTATTRVAKDQLPQVLVVEDNADVRHYLATCLQDQYQLLFATNGQLGIDQAIEGIPDLIISDVMMPQKDGFELCDELKNDPRTSHIPIILLTAKADGASKLTGLRRGADAYLAKPFEKVELLIRLEKLLESREKLKQYYLTLAASGAQMETTEVAVTEDSESKFVQKVRAVIQANLVESDFGVEELCREVGMSRSQLHRKLSALTGQSANKLIRSVRLQKAKELLADKNLTVAAVAYDAGFNDPDYFHRVFKREFGMTPTAFRKDG